MSTLTLTTLSSVTPLDHIIAQPSYCPSRDLNHSCIDSSHSILPCGTRGSDRHLFLEGNKLRKKLRKSLMGNASRKPEKPRWETTNNINRQ
ncbi:hypothetical protein Csa_008212 [Cucumis sativus]|nr:hypothetical protein Csa_008212 [Cucumis sativus]